MKKRILSYGNPVYDLISTPFLRRTDRVLSGCSTNACLAAAKLGEKPTLIGTVGPEFLNRLKDDLNDYQVESHLSLAKETGGFSLIYDDRGDRELSVLGIADRIPLSSNGYHQADFILFGPILGEVTADLAEHVIAHNSTPIILDPQGLLRKVRNGRITHELTDEFEIIAGLSNIVKANEIETLIITGVEPRAEPDRAVKELYKCGCQIAIVTLAEAGSVIYNGENIYHIPPFTTQAIDPTGAGDTYAAGFMVKYLETPDDLFAVGCFASSVASIMVENSGPDFQMTRSDVDRRMMDLLSGPHQLKL